MGDANSQLSQLRTKKNNKDEKNIRQGVQREPVLAPTSFKGNAHKMGTIF